MKSIARECDRSQQPGSIAEAGEFDADVIGGKHADASRDLISNGVEQKIAESRHASAEDNQIGMKNRDDIRGGDSDPGCCSFERVLNRRIVNSYEFHFPRSDAIRIPIDCLVEMRGQPHLHQANPFGCDRGSAGECFQAATVAAAAEGAIGQNCLMTKLPRRSERTEEQFSFHADASSDSRSDREEGHRQPGCTRSMSESKFSQRRRAGIVENANRAGEPCPQNTGNFDIPPVASQVGQKSRTTGLNIDQPRSSEADGGDRRRLL